MPNRIADKEAGVLPLPIRADLLKTAMLEDRQEVRLLKGRIYQLSTFVTVSSFAVTAFLVGRVDLGGHPRAVLLLVVDASFLALLWVSFLRLKRDLDNARKCLELREDMIHDLREVQEGPFILFPSAEWKANPRISENGLYWIVSLATGALVLKMVVAYFEFGR